MSDRRRSFREIIAAVGHTVGNPLPSSELEQPKKNATAGDNPTVKLPARVVRASRPCPPDTTTDTWLPDHGSGYVQP